MQYLIATYSLNQWSLDFDGNTQRILKTIYDAASVGAMYRSGPELELSGYSLEDAFFEVDTLEHSWQCLEEILKESINHHTLIIDIGMPIRKDGSLYNCRVVLYRGRILFIRAKTKLANEGIYREKRYFTPWSDNNGLNLFELPDFIQEYTGQKRVLFGSNFVLELPVKNDLFTSYAGTFKIGYEICQELWEAEKTSSSIYSKSGCHLIFNGSGSYWQLRKMEQIKTMIKSVTASCGGCYAFSNLIGCDGQRIVFDGQSSVFLNGVLVTESQNTQIFREYLPVYYLVDIQQIDAYRTQNSINAGTSSMTTIELNYLFSNKESLIDLNQQGRFYKLYLDCNISRHQSSNISLYLQPKWRYEEEISNFVTLWLWDYLRRSCLKGFILPLSGGLDSSSVATLVFCLCTKLSEYLSLSNDNIKPITTYFAKIHGIPDDELKSLGATGICKKLFRCLYISTKYSGKDTFRRAKVLAESIGAEFVHIDIEKEVELKRSNSLSRQETLGKVSLSDQNLQARLRMVTTYDHSEGNRIVLSAGNVDEALVGYLTKYDCSSADINPIGGICKNDLKGFLTYCANFMFKSNPNYSSIIEDIIEAPPSAELTGDDQRDEEDLGMTYDEICALGRVRRGNYGCFGPVGTFKYLWVNRQSKPFCSAIRCLSKPNDRESEQITELANLVKRFYSRYAVNRHKQTVLPPSLHAETYSPDDNRFDHRQILYNSNWTIQFKTIDKIVEQLSKDEHQDPSAASFQNK